MNYVKTKSVSSDINKFIPKEINRRNVTACKIEFYVIYHYCFLLASKIKSTKREVSKILTEKIGEPLRLIVMLNSHANGVEEYEDDDEPVEVL